MKNLQVLSTVLRRLVIWRMIMALSIVALILSLEQGNISFVHAQSACPPVQFEPSGGQFGIDDQLGGIEWEVNGFGLTATVMSANGNIRFDEFGVTVDNAGSATVEIWPLQDCLIESISVTVNVIDPATNPYVSLSAFDLLDELRPVQVGSSVLNLSSPALNQLQETGERIILNIESVMLSITEISINSAQFAASSAAIRILLVTQNNHVAEYHVSVVPGIARGHPNQFNQWLTTVLDGTRGPLDIYGIWDPRLTLIHSENGAHSEIEFDDQTAYLFDIVLPFTDNYNGGMPREVLIHDQELQLIADVDLTAAINEYCAEQRQNDPTCPADDLSPIDPIADFFGASFLERPEASIEQEISVDSPNVAECLPLEFFAQPDVILEGILGCGAEQGENLQ